MRDPLLEKLQYGEDEAKQAMQELQTRNVLRDNVFRCCLGHLRLEKDFGGEEKFNFEADHHFVYAQTDVPMPGADPKRKIPMRHFGKVWSVEEDRITLDSSTTITKEGIVEAKLYNFAVPVFPEGEIASIKDNLKQSGILCESLWEWLRYASEGIKKVQMEVHVPIPKVAIICSKFLKLDAEDQPVSEDTILSEHLLELGFLLSHSAHIIVFDKEGRDGKSMLHSYLKQNWKDLYEKWIDVKAERNRIKFVDADSAGQLRKRVAGPLSFSVLKEIWENDKKDIGL